MKTKLIWGMVILSLIRPGILECDEVCGGTVLAAVIGPNQPGPLRIGGELRPERAQVVFEGDFVLESGVNHGEEVIVATRLEAALQVSRERVDQSIDLQVRVLHGQPEQLLFGVEGEGAIEGVSGLGIRDWGVFYDARGKRQLLIRLQRAERPIDVVNAVIVTRFEIETLPAEITPIRLIAPEASLSAGSVRVTSGSNVQLEMLEFTGLRPVSVSGKPDSGLADLDVLMFQGTGELYVVSFRVRESDSEASRIRFANFDLSGRLERGRASFRLRGTVHVSPSKGGRLELLSGAVAMTDLGDRMGYGVEWVDGRYELVFEKPGDYPIAVGFDTVVTENQGVRRVEFGLVGSTLRPIELTGLLPDTELRFASAARPERLEDRFVSFLPAAGGVRFEWQDGIPEARGKLFYSAGGTVDMVVGSGVIRQVHRLRLRVMQGEMNVVAFAIEGEGELTQVQGDGVLAWNVEPVAGGPERRLVVRLNQSRAAEIDLQVHTQMALGAFPLRVVPLRLRPFEAVRYGGHIRLASDGAVRLEVVEAQGLSQVSPEQVPPETAPGNGDSGSPAAAFTFRFSDADFALAIQAEAVRPEVSVSQLLVHHLGETDESIESDLELEIREAPLRELGLRIPEGFSVSRLQAPFLGDSFVQPGGEGQNPLLRLVFSQPLTGHQVVQVRLERTNTTIPETWTLGRIEPENVKSVRGYIAVLATPTLRLNPGVIRGVAEMAPAFFPKRVDSIQSAYRIQEPVWQISLGVERVAMSVQVDAFHLFSVGQGVSYGSTLLNYFITGAPLATLKFQVAESLSNAEFVGREVRNWKRTADGYEVDLQAPVSGAYTLLVTYEQLFAGRGQTLSFTGVQPLEVQSERGYAVVISTDPFRIEPVTLSPGLIPLQPQEIPAEYRLLYDAPVLAAYQFTGRPFELSLALTPREQGETVPQIVDRAVLNTHVSRDGEVLTEARYYLKSKGHSYLRVLPQAGVRLWSAEINGVKVVPVMEEQAHLIPLPQSNDPNTLIPLTLNLASKSADPGLIQVDAPVLSAPVVLLEWRIEPDDGEQLRFRGGSLEPEQRSADVSGLGWLGRLIAGTYGRRMQARLAIALVLLGVASMVWGWVLRSRPFAWNRKGVSGVIVGVVACGMGLVALGGLSRHGAAHRSGAPVDLRFTVPIQAAESSLSVRLETLSLEPTAAVVLGYTWPALVGLLLGGACLMSSDRRVRGAGTAVAWMFVFWAVLRVPNGANLFVGALGGFFLLQVALPFVVEIWRRRHIRAIPMSVGGVIPGLLILWIASQAGVAAATVASVIPLSAVEKSARPLSVLQEAHASELFVRVVSKLTWNAGAGDSVNLLSGAAVLTRIDLDGQPLSLIEAREDGGSLLLLKALQAGAFDVTLEYQVPLGSREGMNGFAVPTPPGLMNRIDLFVDGQPVDLISSDAVSVVPLESPATGGNRFRIVLKPIPNAWIAWRPRRRDPGSERTLFYAEFTHLLVPSAGVVEGVHAVKIRAAQGELRRLVFRVPETVTVTDVLMDGGAVWRFDPDSRALDVQLDPARSGEFQVRVLSQATAQALPYERKLGLLSVEGASGQMGLVGIASGPEVQLADVAVSGLVRINLEDFPKISLAGASGDSVRWVVRRAFRYTDPEVTVALSVAAVDPDIRVVSANTLSVSEDRTLLSVRASVEIARTGVFKLSFAVPEGMDVETVSSAVMTHWTQVRSGEDRIVTLHLRARTEGRLEFSVTLVGSGIRDQEDWPAPRLIVREAGKQTGELLLVPEQGMRLHVTARDGVSPTETPQNDGQQKGALAFRLLHDRWQLRFSVEQMAPWVQVSMLEDVTVREGQIKVVTNFDYQIENSGLKRFVVSLPDAAQGVRFEGADLVGSVRQETDGGTNRLWEVRLGRRVIGAYSLQVLYGLVLGEDAVSTHLWGARAAGVNLHRTYLTIRSGGRLNVAVRELPLELQRADWQLIPNGLRAGVVASEPNLAFRALQPEFGLELDVIRHEAALVLPARVESVKLTSVVSESGAVLTQVRLRIHPGDKRMLHLKLPAQARFWFAFSDQRSIRPWLEGDEILLPLEENSRPEEPSSLEFYYSAIPGQSGPGTGRQRLAGPEFDLPLEDITWDVFLPAPVQLTDWTGSLQLRGEGGGVRTAQLDIQSYIESERAKEQAVARDAETYLQLGNSLVREGAQQQARQAFKSAWGLSQHDQAFNEDARVQLENLRLQQALVGLNYWRNNSMVGNVEGSAPQAGQPKLRAGRDVQYTQQEARQILGSGSQDENAILSRLAERLIRQQEGARVRAPAIRASLPEQGRLFTFTRSIQVDTWAGLNLDLKTRRVNVFSWRNHVPLAVGLFLWVLLMLALSRGRRMVAPEPGVQATP